MKEDHSATATKSRRKRSQKRSPPRVRTQHPEHDPISDNVQLVDSVISRRSRESESASAVVRSDAVPENDGNPLRIRCLEPPRTRRKTSRSVDDLQPFIDMDLNTIGQDSSVDTGRSSRVHRQTGEVSRGTRRPVRTLTPLPSVIQHSNETLTQQDIELLFLPGKYHHKSTGSKVAPSGKDSTSAKQLLHGSSSETSGVHGITDKGRRTSNLRSLNLESANTKPTLISPLGSSLASDLVSLESESRATSAVSVPAVSDSYIDRNNYVTKPGWELRSQDLSLDSTTRSTTIENLTTKIQLKKAVIPGTTIQKPLEPIVSASRPSSAQMSQLGDDLFSLRLKARNDRVNPLGAKMDVLSMEKVFNDPSFHGIYEQYSRNRGYSRHAGSTRTDAVPKKDESPLAKAVSDQIPNKVAILDTEVLSLLTDKVLRQNPFLKKLQQASFRKRTDGTIECLSVMDLGLEKKDHQFLTETWLNLAKLTDGCRQIYAVIEASGCQGSAFVRNIMSFISHAIDQGLELAAVLIKTATFVVVRDGQPNDLLDYVQQVRQLTESLNSHTDFLDTVREVLTENFSAIPLVAESVVMTATGPVIKS